jgi:hypothetical protein
VAWCWCGGGSDGVVLHVWARGRVRWLDLVTVDKVPPLVVFVFVVVFVVFFFVFVVVVVVFFVVVGLFRRVLFLAARQDLDTRRVFVAIIFGARVVVDSDSFSESDGDVSVTLSIAGR